MSVFVLLGAIDYEGTTLLGVYSTRELAQYHLEQYEAQASVLDDYDHYMIAERPLDVEAEPYFG